MVAADLDPRGQHRRAVRRIELEEDAGTRVVDDRVPDRVHVERRLTAVGRADVQTRTRLPVRKTAGARQRASLDAEPNRPGRGDDVAPAAGQGRVADRDPFGQPGRSQLPGADQDVGRRRAPDGQVIQRHLVAEHEDAVDPPRPGNDEAKPADRDPDRKRFEDVRMVDVEDRSRPDGTPRPGPAASLPRTESDDARTVRGDGGVVVRDPQASRPIALPVRQLRDEDVAARVEPCLQGGGVVSPAGARRGGGHQGRHERRRQQQPSRPGTEW